MKYRVEWATDVDADNPEAAAFKALAIQRDSKSEEVCFTVFWDDDENFGQIDIDLCPTTEIPPYDTKRNRK